MSGGPLRQRRGSIDAVGGDVFHRIAIIGVGLIGGSLARALRRAGQRAEIVGFGRNHLNLQRALDLGVIDRYETSLDAAVCDADLIVVAVPVGVIGTVLRDLRPHIAPGSVVTDVGSTKVSVVQAAREALGESFSSFVPGHPIAGNERQGVEASSASLFDGRAVLLTPTAETRPVAVAGVRRLWEATGARVSEMDPDHHDQVLAATSHLPHVLAYALVDTLARMDESEEIFDYAAGGFRDFTRIASSDPGLWRDICIANRDHIASALERYQAELADVADALKRGDDDALFERFARAKRIRDRKVVR